MSIGDLDTLSHWFEHLEDLSLFDRNMPLPLNSDDLRKAWKKSLRGASSGKSYWFGISDADGELVGIIGLDDINYVHGDGVFAFYLDESVRRKGIGIRAAAMLIDIAFGQLRLNRITSYFRSDNEATKALTNTLRFAQEGVIRQGWFAGGKHHDVIVIGLLASDWANSCDKLRDALADGPKIKLGRSCWPEIKGPNPK